MTRRATRIPLALALLVAGLLLRGSPAPSAALFLAAYAIAGIEVL